MILMSLPPVYWRTNVSVPIKRVSGYPIHIITPALSLQPEDALEASKIATALQYSFRNRVAVEFDDEGEPIMP